MAKKPDSGINGILVVDKPADFTSFDVVAKLRGICGTRKIGHGGTLDPMATGVLPVFMGRTVKAVDMQPKQDKTYEGVIRFGLATDTGDVTGEVLRRSEGVITADMLRAVLPQFVGKQQQLPPMYSAVKIDGKPLYKYAREGKEVARKPRDIEIFSIDLLEECADNDFSLRVHCSKGTYIRTLFEDIGNALGQAATLAALRRTKAGMFLLQDAYTFEEIQQAKDENRLEELLLPADIVFACYPEVKLDDAKVARLRNGAPVYGLKLEQGLYRISGSAGFVALANLQDDGCLHIEKWFATTVQ